jgi:hypothetical protein
MSITPKYPVSLLAGLAAMALSSAAAQANNNAQVYSCYTNRFGVEQCGNTNAEGGARSLSAVPRASAAPQPDDPQARLKRYCDDRKKAGKIDADGVCAAPVNGN